MQRSLKIPRFLIILSIISLVVLLSGLFKGIEHYSPDLEQIHIEFFHHIGHFLDFSGKALVIWIFIEETIKMIVMPIVKDFLKNDFLNELFKELRAIRDTVGEVLKEEGLIQSARSVPIVESQDQTIITGIIETEMGSDRKLKAAEKMVLDGNYNEAVDALIKLVKKDEKYMANLITTLVFSPDPDHWALAEKKLREYPEFSEPAHYTRLAFKQWLRRNCIETIRLGEMALTVFNNKGPVHDGEIEWRIKNSLAYYYADFELEENAGKAIEYATSAVNQVSSEKDSSDKLGLVFARRLATLGYVKITFGKTKKEVRDGIHDCEEARRLGSSDELYFSHLARAQSRWGDVIQNQGQS